jgi:hypothetical protein
MSDEFPRRAIQEKWSFAEKIIDQAIKITEDMGCDEDLTDAVVLLAEAQNKVADFVDKK